MYKAVNWVAWERGPKGLEVAVRLPAGWSRRTTTQIEYLEKAEGWHHRTVLLTFDTITGRPRLRWQVQYRPLCRTVPLS